MLDKNQIVKMTNRSKGRVGYTIPDLGNLHRVFESGETKEVTMEELRKLSYIPGGQSLLNNYFIINEENAVNELVTNVEPEYFYTEEDVKNLLLYGSLDELKDCLDFAPEGTIGLVKKLAVDLRLNDIAKRNAIQEATGFNVNSAVMVSEETSEEKQEDVKVRRVAEKNNDKKEEKTSKRRTTPTTSRYKITSIQE